MAPKINRPMNETLRYKNMVAGLKSRPAYAKEAALLKELAGGKTWRIDAVLESILDVKPEDWGDWNYIDMTGVMKQAAMFGRLHAVEAICERMKWENDGGTVCAPLLAAYQVAVIHGHYKVADFLYDKGARPDYLVEKAPRADGWAASEGDIRKIAHLVDKGANASRMLFLSVEMAPEAKKLKIVDFLIAKGANVNYAQNGSWTPFLQVVKRRNYDLAEKLLDRGAKPEEGNAASETLLTLIDGGRKGMPLLRKLLARGAQADADLVGRAIHGDNLDAARALLESGVAIETADSADLLTAAVACRWQKEAVDLCLKYGADPQRALDDVLRPRESWQPKPKPQTVEALQKLVAARAAKAPAQKPPQP